MLKQLSVASAGVALVTLGSGAVNPAQAATLTQLDYSGGFLIQLLFPVEASDGVQLFQTSITVDNLEERLSDSEISVNDPFSYLGVSDFADNLTANDTAIYFGGAGVVQQDDIFLSNFDFFYSSIDDILTVTGFNPTNLQTCFTDTCSFQGGGLFYANVSSIPFLGFILFNINQSATPLPSPTAAFLPETLATPTSFAAFSVADSTPVPEPATAAGLLGIGAFLATRRRKQQSRNKACQ